MVEFQIVKYVFTRSVLMDTPVLLQSCHKLQILLRYNACFDINQILVNQQVARQTELCFSQSLITSLLLTRGQRVQQRTGLHPTSRKFAAPYRKVSKIVDKFREALWKQCYRNADEVIFELLADPSNCNWFCDKVTHITLGHNPTLVELIEHAPTIRRPSHQDAQKFHKLPFTLVSWSLLILNHIIGPYFCSERKPENSAPIRYLTYHMLSYPFQSETHNICLTIYPQSPPSETPRHPIAPQSPEELHSALGGEFAALQNTKNTQASTCECFYPPY